MLRIITQCKYKYILYKTYYVYNVYKVNIYTNNYIYISLKVIFILDIVLLV